MINCTKEFDLEMNLQKSTYMLLFRLQNAEKYHDMKTGNRYLGNVAQFKYLGTTVSNQYEAGTRGLVTDSRPT
jgi:hypothetical protein